MVSATGGPVLPVVHIRIVREELSEKYPCDFCHRSFPSAVLLGNHINTEHQSLNIQDVYVCSVCRCCLLTQRDLLDHLTLRHKMQLSESSVEEITVCEICGQQLPSSNLYKEHLKIYHTSELLHENCCSLNILEFTLADIWSMGMGEPDYKTFFNILEIPVKGDRLHQDKEGALSSSGNNSAVQFVSHEVVCESSRFMDQTFHSGSYGNTKLVTDVAETTLSILKKSHLNSVPESSIPDSDLASTIHIQDIKSVGKTMKCKSENFIHTETKGELILTVESDEKLIWSKDIVSKVLSSCSILDGTKSCIEDADVIVEKYEDCCNLDQPLFEAKADKEIVWQTQETGTPSLPLTLSVKMEMEEEKTKYSSHHESLTAVTENSDREVGRKNVTPCQNTDWPAQLTGREEKEEESMGEIIIELLHDDSKTAVLELSGDNNDGTAIHELPVEYSKNEQLKLSKDEDGGIKHFLNRKTCRVCGMLFGNYLMLEKHESDAHGVRIKCELCNDSFAYSKSLRTHHQRKHSDSIPFQCEICLKSFKSRGNLWTHRLTHTNYSSRRFKCSKCPLRYHSKSKLNNHLQSHSGTKKYQCGECKRGFSYPGILLKHMEKHFTDAHKNLPENESLYLVEVEVEDTNTISESTEVVNQPVVPGTSNS